MGKKEKSMSVEGAQRVLKLIDEFEAPGNKGRHDRKHFRSLLVVGVDENAITREKLRDEYGFSSEELRGLFAGAAAPITAKGRTILLNTLRTAAETKLGLRAEM